MKRNNNLFALVLSGGMFGMLGLSYAAVPLYRIFCETTGYGGTPQLRGAAGPGGGSGMITVRFDANTSPQLPWRFRPDERSVTIPLGEDRLASYTGRNDGTRPITGVATYNVTPEKAAPFFHKTACFCFNEQTLEAGQEMAFPLSFWVDPAIATNPDTRDVKTITLSYTFFRSIDDAARNGLERVGPHVGARAAVTP